MILYLERIDQAFVNEEWLTDSWNINISCSAARIRWRIPFLQTKSAPKWFSGMNKIVFGNLHYKIKEISH